MDYQTVQNCKRCNTEKQMDQIKEYLCSRCRDIIEFGYHSFPAYELEEYKEARKKELVTMY